MKVISDNVLSEILDELDIHLSDISYYTSGKCSDLYHYDGKLLKILKWYIASDDVAKVTDKFKKKTEFISYLNTNMFDCLILSELKGDVFKVVELGGFIYVIYLMNYLSNVGNDYDKTCVGDVLFKLHTLSRNYPGDCNSDWILEYESVYTLCSDDMIKSKLKEYFEEISLIEPNNNNYGIIHYDSNKNNYVLFDDRVFMIDFDSMCNGYYLMDVANYLFSLYNVDFVKGMFMEKEKFHTLSISILNKYNFDYNDIDILNLFINYRLVYIYSILSKFIVDDNVKKKIENIIFKEKIVLNEN